MNKKRWVKKKHGWKRDKGEKETWEKRNMGETKIGERKHE